jgi:hypothetical protein
MKLDRRLIAVIARLHPEIYDGPHFGGPVYRGTHVQSGVALGRQAGSALLQAAWLGQVFGLELAGEDWEGDWCPTYPRHPKLPPGVGPIGPDPDPNPVYLTGYYLGLSSVLADGVERGVTSPVVGAVLEASVGNLELSVQR